MTYEIVHGDLSPSMPVSVTRDGAAVDCSAATSVVLQWVSPDGIKHTDDLTAIDASAGTFVMNWSVGDTDWVGAYFGQVIITEDGLEASYPSDGTRLIWFVNPDVDEYDWPGGQGTTVVGVSSSRLIATGDGLQGGGDLSSDRTLSIADGAVTLAKLVDIATNSVLGRINANTGVVEVLTGTQVTSLLDVFTSTQKGVVPASGGVSTDYLCADGTWNAPVTAGFTLNGTADDVSTLTVTKTQPGLITTNDAAVYLTLSGTTTNSSSSNAITGVRVVSTAVDGVNGKVTAQGVRVTMDGDCDTNYGIRVDATNAKRSTRAVSGNAVSLAATVGVAGGYFNATGGPNTPIVNGIYAKGAGGSGVPYAAYLDGPVRTGDLYQQGTKAGFYNTAPITKQTGVAVTVEAIHAALVALGLIGA